MALEEVERRSCFRRSAGFATTDEVQEFIFTAESSEKATVSYEFIFEDEPTVFEFTKTSLTDGKEVEGAKLTVTDENGEVVDEWVSADVKAIFACNDNLALAAVQALTELGNSNVLVYGVDYTSDAKAAIEDGTMMGSMTYSSAIYTKAAISMAMNLAQGGSYDEPLYLPLTLVTQDNVADMDGWK